MQWTIFSHHTMQASTNWEPVLCSICLESIFTHLWTRCQLRFIGFFDKVHFDAKTMTRSATEYKQIANGRKQSTWHLSLFLSPFSSFIKVSIMRIFVKAAARIFRSELCKRWIIFAGVFWSISCLPEILHYLVISPLPHLEAGTPMLHLHLGK